MHNFDHLIYRGTQFSLNALNDVYEKVIDDLTVSGSTSSVKNLQMIRLQKAIMAVGMFSLFESILQMGLRCTNGFRETKKILIEAGEYDLHEQFDFFTGAINVLKHGRGSSYNILIKNHQLLPFRIKLPDENFFFEGDVSEISTLIEVDDTFVLKCAQIIEMVSNIIRTKRPDYNR